jgi:Carboxypeptidase regulatory-like domain
MFKRLLSGPAIAIFAGIIFSLAATAASAQTTNGSITIETLDSTKALLPGTHLVLTDNGTNVAREGTTLSSGTFTFAALPPSTYRLTVERSGFANVNYDSIVVQAGVATPLNIILKVGSTTQEVDVSAVSVPVIEVSSNTLSTSINLEEVNNLPVNNRSLLGLQALSPGYASTTGNGTGTFDGTPQAGYQANVDGINATSSRGKAGAGSGSAITFRVENIQEFTVQSGELPPSQGGGQSAAQTLFVTNRGTNRFHGSVFENHQEDAFNARPWNFGFQAPQHKPHLLINDFGGSVGGPIFKNKLFFFGNFSARVSPNTNRLATTLPTLAALAGNYSYFNTAGTVSTINVLQGAGAAGLDPNLNGGVAFQEKLNEAVYSLGNFTQTSSQLNTRTLNFAVPAKLTQYYPSARLDYTVTPKLQLSLSGNLLRSSNKGIFQDPLPGDFQIKTSGQFTQNYVASLGADYTVTQNLLNQFKVGFLYTHTINSPEADGFDVGSQGATNWNFQGISSGNFSITPQGNYYPYLQINDDLSWQKGAHTIKIGGNAWHQQDHFYNPPIGYPNISLGLSNQDSAFNSIFSLVPTSGANTPGNLGGAQGDVEAMYGWLDGRVTGISSSYPINRATGSYTGPGTYGLDEASMGGGVYVQDSLRVRPDLTFNYGLRWDFISDIHDVKNGYTGPSAVDLFGSSGYLNIFQPGANSGSANPLYTTSGHKYNSSLVLPQPQVGFAWNPNNIDGFLGKIFGAGKTVIRGSYTLKNYTEGGQSFWQSASNSGYNFFNSNSLNASNTVGPQFFVPGTIKLATPPASCTSHVTNCVNQATMAQATLPPLFQSPSVYLTTIPESTLFFKGSGGPAAIDPNIKQPYVESYTFGIQRQIGHSSAFEIRYVGNRSIHDWISYNYNEINALNNGFLQDFVAAQQNLAINTAAGLTNDFSNHGSGPAMPILSAAFAGGSASNFKNASFATSLRNGSLGGLAASIANNETFFCNVVSQAFAPCKAIATAPLSSVYPSNLFQVNPYLEGSQAALLSSKGSSNYNSLQMEFRQKVSHGLNLNVNYTYGKTLGNSSNQASGSIGNTANIITLHNLQYNYQPISYDIRNALKLSSTYALPFGKNRAFLSHGRLENYVVGGWTAGAIFIYQSGSPILLTGALSSTLSGADGGVSFVGTTTARDIQKSVHVTRAAPGNSFVNLIDPKFQGTSTANPAYVVPNKTPGVEGNLPFIYGPKWNNFDLSATKDLPIFEAVHINLQGIFLNAFNHPEWVGGGFSTQSPTFGTTGSVAQNPRRIELRANLTF